MNSFPNIKTRVNFLNKFYQCLMASKMPHKVRKLVVAGPKDSGKTSWASIFHRLIPAGNIASITSERQFSGAMIKEDTQLVFVDEWSADTIQSDFAKTILQGGWMVTAVKHEAPRCVTNNNPFYITTNHVPNFGEEDENVKRRIAIYKTASLPVTLPGVDRWMFDYAMDCVAWLVNQINANINIVDEDELWYEPGYLTDTTIVNNEGMKLFQPWKVKVLSRLDLEEEATPKHAVTSLIHDNFAVESRYRRLARKRRCRTTTHKRTSYVQDSSDEPDIGDVNRSVDEPVQYSQPSTSITLLQPVETNATVAIQPQTSEADEEEESSSRNFTDQSTTDVTEYLQSNRRGETASVLETLFPEDAENVGKDTGMRQEDAEESISPRIQSPSRWVMNNDLYLAKVCQLLQHQFYWKEHTNAHVLSFEARKREAHKKEKRFWTKPDPKIDAWMLTVGEVREVFDLNALVSKHPDVEKHVARFRKSVNVLILPCSCPVVKALKLMKKEPERANENPNAADDEEESQPQGPGNLSSQSYWTTIKKWRPW